MSDAVVSEVRIITLLISKLEMVFTFEEVVDIRDEGAPLTHFQRLNLLIVIFKEVTRLTDDISVAVAWGFELSLTNSQSCQARYSNGNAFCSSPHQLFYFYIYYF